MKSFLKRMERELGGFFVRIGNYLIRHGEFRDPIYIQINSEIKIKYKSLKRHKGKHLKEAFAIADRMVANMDLDLDFYNDYYALKTIVDRYNIYSVLIGYNYEISKLYQKQRDLQNSDVSDSEKYELNREIKKEINDLQEKALTEMMDIRITGVYAEAGGKRYNFGYDDEHSQYRWYEIRPKNADGTDNWYYQNEQAVTEMFSLSPAEYWNNREAYSDAYYVANHYDDPFFETVKNVLGIESFAEYASGLSIIYADKDKNGKSISGTRKRKVKAYIASLDIPDIEKKILFKAEYNYNKQHDHEIRKYLEGLDLSPSELRDVLDELGMR